MVYDQGQPPKRRARGLEGRALCDAGGRVPVGAPQPESGDRDRPSNPGCAEAGECGMVGHGRDGHERGEQEHQKEHLGSSRIDSDQEKMELPTFSIHTVIVLPFSSGDKRPESW